MDKSSIANTLKEIIQQGSLSRLQKYAQRPDFQLQKLQPELKVFAHWMALILISGKSLRVTFKVHFMGSDAKQLASKVYNKKPEEVALAQASDFITEYCNLTAGKLKKALEDQGISTGISLPLLTRGFDEVFFPTEDKNSTFHDSWKLFVPESFLTCSAVVQVFEEEKLGHLKNLPETPEKASEGEIEFL